MKRLLLALLIASGLYAQGIAPPPSIIFVVVDPSGGCFPAYTTLNTANGDLSGCINHTWSVLTSGGGGGGTVTVVGGGSLVSTALVTGGGGTTIQTLNSSATMDMSGNISTPGSVITGAGGTVAGYHQFGQGTAPAAGTTAVTLSAPSSVTSYVMKLPGTAATGIYRGDNSSGTVTMSSSELSGDGTTSGSNALTLASRYKIITCQPGLGDGLNAITAATYLNSDCLNEFGSTWTITGIKCYTDNSGSSTLGVTNGAGTSLLTGVVTCSSSWAAGTQSGTTTIASADFVKFTFISDGSTKQTTWVVTGVR